ncbi:hypothetical protein SAMN05216270_10428 [Glycomyces harbinensis]|uniref:Uncharacterized protein n=1 Tax=Glycomyces harbinensis TaxID=58114 RepID=A0A1G6URU4_9ACTN|nr:hypothetical protein SAMN05216270_10428 [Glycomyces harbinensis]
MYDQNRPDEPSRPSGEERTSRRRIGRSWGPPAEEAPEAAEEARQGMAQAPEQYRFDPDRGRRHRYSEDPTGQVPNVEIAETGPMVPATRRPSPGEQFAPLPAAPETPQGPQGFPNDQQPQQPQSPFAPPGANHEYSAPPGVNHEYGVPGANNAQPGANHEFGAQPGVNHGAPQPGVSQEFAPPGANQTPGANPEFGAPQGANHEFGATPGAHQGGPSAPPEYTAPPAPPVPPQQHLSAPQDFGAPQQHPGYSAPPMPGDYAPQQHPQGPAQPGPNQDFAPGGASHEYSAPAPNSSAPQHFSAPQANAMPSAPPANPAFATPAPNRERTAPPTPQEPPAPPAAPEPQGYSQPAPPAPPQHTGPIEVPQPPAQQAPPPQPTPAAPAPIPVGEQQTDQFPLVQQQPLTEVSPAAVPSPPVTEQAPLRTAPANRPPFPEPTPPATVEQPGHMPPSPAAVNETESERLVDAVRQVPGVRDAFHVTAPDGASSLRLELEEGVDPDEVHAVVSAVVAEQRAVEPGPQSADEPRRDLSGQVETPSSEIDVAQVGPVVLRRVDIESAGLEAEVSVTLSLGREESTGKVAVPPIDWHIQHAAAAATVEALRPRLGASDVRVEVEHASIVPTGPVKTAVVVILWLDGHSVRRLSGAAVVTAERSRAVVSATLGALAAEVSH